MRLPVARVLTQARGMAAAPAGGAPPQAKQKSGWERAVAMFSSYFEERGLGPQDLPAAIVLHEVRLVHAIECWCSGAWL